MQDDILNDCIISCSHMMPLHVISTNRECHTSSTETLTCLSFSHYEILPMQYTEFFLVVKTTTTKNKMLKISFDMAR